MSSSPLKVKVKSSLIVDLNTSKLPVLYASKFFETMALFLSIKISFSLFDIVCSQDIIEISVIRKKSFFIIKILYLKVKYKKHHFNRMLNISLTYLRGLEITELKEDDMPMV